MNRVLIAVFAVPLLCGSLLAQSSRSASRASMSSGRQTAPVSTGTPPTAPTVPASPAFRIAPGSVMPVQLAKSIDAKKAKKGDEVIAKVTADLRTNAGAVLVPKDTEVVGHVTEAEARSKKQRESQLAIAFDHAVLKNGEQIQMPMSIQAIIAPPESVPSAEPAYGYPGPEPAGMPTAPAGPPGAMGGMVPQAPSVLQPTGIGPTEAPERSPARRHVTANTQGVVGIPNLKLSAAPDPADGSVVSSEKKNVKLDDGTLLLLRVNR